MRVDALIMPIRGSSPLARGLLHRRHPALPGQGIIPARAGFTSLAPTQHSRCRDHPRSRGVYRARASLAPTQHGSSPLARGLRRGRRCGRRRHRIIPARAGFTRGRRCGRRRHRDHPRSRGVYVVPGRVGGAELGSSPLARGLQSLTACHADAAGIIPARAGFTKEDRARTRKILDHPRSRGVYFLMPYFWRPRSGSSPLARGLPKEYRARARKIWIIPARAGFTLA